MARRWLGPGAIPWASLVLTYNLSTYDAAYLELAMRWGVQLATLDDKLKAAAAAAGVPLLVVN
jgi:predicted nucleic acid-binding protein